MRLGFLLRLDLDVPKDPGYTAGLLLAKVAELADALDSKSSIRNWVCGFESLLRH